jgi:hypothetical protein
MDPLTEFDTLATEDLLRLPSAGPKAVRGGAVRVVGYLFATALGTLAAVLL